MMGQAVALRAAGGGALTIIAITSGLLEREQALSIARQSVWRGDWFGQRQILFIHHDGYLELWDKELRK